MLVRTLLRRQGSGTAAHETFMSNNGAGFGLGSASAAYAAAAEAAERAKLPNRATYESMTDADLETLLTTKDRQIGELRHIYENFHYEVDKRFRTMVLDYHDKAMQLAKVHGDMQNSSLNIQREALMRMRMRDEARNRDRRLVQFLCVVATIVFWFWLRRHYILAKQDVDPRLTTSVSGLRATLENFFGSNKRSARSWDTPYEKEVRGQQQKKE
jgi:hypothetical protein